MEPLAGLPPQQEQAQERSGAVVGVEAGAGGGGGGGGSESGRGGGGKIVNWQERITLHYRLFPVEGGDGKRGSGGRGGDLSGCCAAAALLVFLRFFWRTETNAMVSYPGYIGTVLKYITTCARFFQRPSAVGTVGVSDGRVARLLADTSWPIVIL